jgi:multiple sugar transport system permease protein
MSDATVSPRRSRGNKRGLRIIQSVSILIIALVIVSPLFMLLVASLKDDRFQILADMGSFKAFWVTNPTFNNYVEVGGMNGDLAFGRYLINSLFILACTVGAGLVINSMAGFVLAWGAFRARPSS